MATFTIYLLRDTIRTPEDAVTSGAKPLDIADGPTKFGKLFVKSAPPKSPKWADVFEEFVNRNDLGKVQSVAAVFIAPVDNRLFALTFGQGRFLLSQDAYEERFGLIVTLNSIEQDALRSIDKRTFVDDLNSRIQTSQASPAFSFGVDIERDLIRGIVGRPTDPALGRRMSGSDALTVSIDVGIRGLKKILRAYLKKFQSKDYQVNFEWVDKVRQLPRKSATSSHLNDLLVNALRIAWKNNGIVSGCWMSIPEVIDWDRVHGFKFSASRREGVHNDLHLPGLVNEFINDDPTIDFLRKHQVFAVDENQEKVHSWPAYRCIHCEMDVDGKSYILSSGYWFQIDKDFENSINNAYKSIPRYSNSFPICNHDREDEYNEFVASSSQGRWCLMDKKNLKVGGVHDKVEFSDLYGNREIVHIKHYGSSSVLGHLFNQGLTSGELLRSHADYVRLANAELPTSHHLVDTPLGTNHVRRVSEYSIIFAVISKSEDKNLHLPFFAKVILKNVYTRLLELGYSKVMITKISCDPLLKKKIRLAPTRQRRRRRKPARPVQDSP